MVMMNNLYKWMEYVGLEVETLNGWSRRGSSNFAPRGALCHWIAGPRNVPAGRRPSLRVIRDGHSRLPGPLANEYLDRAGIVVLVAAGRCNHAGPGYWMGATGNSHLMGTEPEAADNSDWTAEQRKSYPLVKIAELFAMWEKGLITWNQIASNRIAGHSEYALPKGRKIDINGYTMTSMRSQIAALIPGFKKRVNRRAISVGTAPVFNRNTYKFTDGVTAPTPTTSRKSWFDMATEATLRKVLREELGPTGWNYDGKGGNGDAWSQLQRARRAAEEIRDAIADLPKEIWGEVLSNSLMGDNGTSASASSWLTNTRRFTREYHRETAAALAAQQEIIEQLSAGEGVQIDYTKVQEAARKGASEALANVGDDDE